MKPVDIISRIYIYFNTENTKKEPKFKVLDHVRISKHKNIFAKDYVPIGMQKFLLLKKVKMMEGFIEKYCKNKWNRV